MDRNKEYLRIGWKWKSGGEGEGERDGESDAIERWLVNERRGVERRGEERTEEGSLSLSLSLRCVAGDLGAAQPSFNPAPCNHVRFPLTVGG